MNTVVIPEAFATELLNYFETQVPMRQGENAVLELRRALSQAKEVVSQRTAAERFGFDDASVQEQG